MKIIDYDKPFNFSEKCNIGVVNSDAPFVVLLNDDTEVISSDWLEMMLGYMQETDVAMVGPLLLLEDGRVQSAGHSNTPVPDHFVKEYLEVTSVPFLCSNLLANVVESQGHAH